MNETDQNMDHAIVVRFRRSRCRFFQRFRAMASADRGNFNV